MDTETLDDKAEKEELLLECDTDKASEIVKNSYKKITAGRAIVRQKFFLIYAIVLGMFFIVSLTMIILYGLVWGRENCYMGFIGVLPLCVAIGMSIFVYKKTHKLFDVYFFRYKGKRIVFYVNKRYSILYRSRTDFICINNYSGKTENFTLDTFMNIKLGFSRMIGKMSIKKRQSGYVIKTKEFKYFTVSQFSGNSKLWLDNDFNPKKILIGGVYIYEFRCIDKDFAEKSPEIAMLLDKFGTYI